VALLDGLVVQATEPSPTNPHLSLGLSSLGFNQWPPFASIVTHDEARTSHPIIDNVPVAANGQVVAGTVPHSYYDDFYERIHVLPPQMDVGNLITTQVRVVDVWNAYSAPRTLTAIVLTGEGATLAGPDTFPQVFGAYQMSTWEISVTPAGPPAIDISVNWVFTGEEPALLEVVGNRVVGWMIPPNWSNPLLERIEFRTDVLKKFDGSEQRIALRGTGAHWSFEFRWNASGATMRVLENVLYQWSGQVWALPLFHQGQALTSGVAAGATSITVATADLDYHVGGLAFLHSLTRPEVYEAVEIATVTANAITTVRPTLNTWPASTYIYPARTARLQRSAPAQRFTGSHLYGSAKFLLEEPLVRTPASETTYRSYPVQTSKPEWAQDPGIEYARKLVQINMGIRPPDVDDTSGLAEPVTAFRWAFTSRTAVENFRRWLFARLGRQKAIWLPTFTDDVIVKTQLDAGDNTMDVEACGLVNYVAAGVNRRDLRIEMKNGTVYYRRVSTFVTVDDTTERFTLDSVLGVNYLASDFAQLSWMSLARLDADAVEIAHWTGTVSSALTAMRSPRTSA
jgi:hypothetical protein